MRICTCDLTIHLRNIFLLQKFVLCFGPKERSREKRRIEDHRDSIDTLLIKILASTCDNNAKENVPPQKEVSSHMLFCNSLAPILEKITEEKKRKARVKIQEVLCELESDSK